MSVYVKPGLPTATRNGCSPIAAIQDRSIVTHSNVPSDTLLNWPISLGRHRTAYATRLFEQKVEAPVVQKLLGHADISTTSVYTHLTEPTQAALRRILDKLMTDL